MAAGEVLEVMTAWDSQSNGCGIESRQGNALLRGTIATDDSVGTLEQPRSTWHQIPEDSVCRGIMKVTIEGF